MWEALFIRKLNRKVHIKYLAKMLIGLKKFIYFEKAKQFCEIFTLLLTGTRWDKSKVKISPNFVAFSEYMNFIELLWMLHKVA